jgi:hypothetical protein
MRRQKLVRTRLGACLVVSLAAAAAAATPAQATLIEYGSYKETATEHAEFQAFAACPFVAATELDCSWAQSTYNERWPSQAAKEEYEQAHERKAQGLPSEFKAGNVTVQLKMPVTLRGGIGIGENEEDTWFGAEGAETIQATPQVAQPLTKDVNVALLSPTELNRYTYYVKVSHETKVTATIELAGPASAIKVSVGNLLTETGTAFAFPVKLKLSNPFVGKDCYVGSDSNPIVVEFTTGASGVLQGKSGSKAKQDRNGFDLTVLTDTLVNDTFASPGVEGCGVGGGADAAIDAALGLPSPSGQNLAILNGTLKLATAQNAQEALEGKI